MINRFNKIIILFCFLFVPLTLLYSSNKDVVNVISALNTTLKTRNIESVRPFLAESFSISVVYDGDVLEKFNMILSDGRTANKVELVSEQVKESGQILLDVIFFEPSRQVKSVIGLDKSGKIEFIDYFNTLFGHSRFSHSEHVASFPFEMLEDDKMVIQIKINENDRPLRFMFDTGSDGMAVSKELAEKLNLNITSEQDASLVGGMAHISISDNNDIHISDSLVIKGQSIGIFDNEPCAGCDGIIGLPFVYRYITKVDFINQVIHLYSFGDYKFENRGSLIPIKINYTIMVPCTLNVIGEKDVSGNFVLDTGADFNLIGFSRFVRVNRLLFTGFKIDQIANTQGISNITPIRVGKVAKLKIGDEIQFDNTSVAFQLSYDDAPEFEPDGSLGIHLLKQHNLTIDLLRRNIHLVKH